MLFEHRGQLLKLRELAAGGKVSGEHEMLCSCGLCLAETSSEPQTALFRAIEV
jgi:hypothetical protein